MGGVVEKRIKREYGTIETEFKTDSLLFYGLKSCSKTLMSHNDAVISLPQGFKTIASSKSTEIAAFEKNFSLVLFYIIYNKRKRIVLINILKILR